MNVHMINVLVKLSIVYIYEQILYDYDRHLFLLDITQIFYLILYIDLVKYTYFS